MRPKLTFTSVLLGAFALTFLAVPKASATWGFLGQTFGNDVMCSGEVNSPNLPTVCDLTSPSGARVKTSNFGGFCAASIWCGNIVKTCLASDTRSSRGPVMCFAVGYGTGFARAECKSDHGNYYLTC